MFRFGRGFGLLECPLSEFNDDYHGDLGQDETHIEHKTEKIVCKKITTKKKLKHKKRHYKEKCEKEI